MLDAFIAKLRHGADLTDTDEAALRSGIEQVRTVEAETDLVREGAPPGHVRLVIDGIALRYKSTPQGSRRRCQTNGRARPFTPS